MSSDLFDAFSEREIATIMWLAALSIFVLSKPAVRAAFGPLWDAFNNRIILSLIAILFAYVTMAVFVLWKLGIWDVGQLKNTLAWFLFVVPSSLSRVMSKNAAVFRDWLADNLRILAILEFLTGHYTFNIWVELLLVPFATLLVGMIAVAREEDANQQTAKRILEWIMAAIGIVMLARAVPLAIVDFHNATASSEAARDFYIEPLLSVALLPFLFVLYVYSSYERVLGSLRFAISNADVRAYAKARAKSAFGPNVGLLDRWRHYVVMDRPTKAEEIDLLITEAWEAASLEKYPPPVDTSEGWCPGQVIKLLKAYDLLPQAYRRAFDGTYFATATRSLKFKYPRMAHLNYNVNGQKVAATRIDLELVVDSVSNEPDADESFFSAGAFLIQEVGAWTLDGDGLKALRISGPFDVTVGYCKIEYSLRTREAPIAGYERKLTFTHDCHREPADQGPV